MAETTTSDMAAESPKVPQRKNRANKATDAVAEVPSVSKALETIVEVSSEASTTSSECLERLALPEQSVTPEPKQTEDTDKKVVKPAKDAAKPKPDSPRTRLKICEGDHKKLKAVEQLQQENASLKKSLESERSALREQRAQHEAESRRERAEARRREASLESQLRVALKGGMTSAPVGPTHDNALAAALEATKAANKCLQQKLQVMFGRFSILLSYDKFYFVFLYYLFRY